MQQSTRKKKMKEDTSNVDHHISWLHQLTHSQSHLVFSCCSTQDKMSLPVFYFLLQDYLAMQSSSKIMQLSATLHILLLLHCPGLWRSSVRLSHTHPDIPEWYFFVFLLHGGHLEILGSAFSPDLILLTSLTFVPKTYGGQGWENDSYPYTPRTWADLPSRIQVFAPSEFSPFFWNVYLVAVGKTILIW